MLLAAVDENLLRSVCCVEARECWKGGLAGPSVRMPDPLNDLFNLFLDSVLSSRALSPTIYMPDQVSDAAQ